MSGRPLLTCLLLAAVLLLGGRHASAAIPQAAQDDPMFALGYLNCDLYSGVLNNGTGDSTAEIQTCINDSQINGLAAFFPCGTYMISATLTAYEFQNWNPNANPPAVRGADPRVWQIVGSTINVAGGGEACRPEIKLIASTAAFNNASVPRPMFIFRNFLGLNSSATTTTPPSNPYGLPAPAGAYKEGQGNNFNSIIRNIHFNTNSNAGAIGLTMMAPQSSGVYNTKVTATGSFSGFYGLPGQGGVTVNVEVIGGKHCILSGTITVSGVSLGLSNTSGPVFAGVTCTNQTEEAIIIEDTASVTIAGLNVTKSTTGSAIVVRSPLALIDSRMSFSGAGANVLAIDNNAAETMYGRNLWWSGTTNLIRSGTTSCPGGCTTTGSGTWPWLAEYVHNDPFNKDGNNTVTTYPTYTHGGSGDKHFEVRSWIATGTGLPVLSGNAFPIQMTVTDKGAAGPPSDLLSRHVPASWPSFQDGTFVNPVGMGSPACVATVVLQGLGNDAEEAGITGVDCKNGLQAAIDLAASQGHNRVHLPRGVIALSGSVTLGADTKLMGAGQGMANRITYKSTWLPTTETYYITTASSTTGTAYMGFFAMLVRTEPTANQQTAYYHWRVGKNSTVMGLQYSRENAPPDNASQPLKLIRFSANGGGKHYGPNIYAYQLDSNTDMRMIYADGTTQPLSIYGMDVEYTKAPSPAYTHANVEFRDGSNVRVYGCKREGNSPTGRIHNFTNIAVHGCGVMSVLLSGANQRYWQMTGTTNNILIAVQIVADMKAAATSSAFLSEDITTPAGLRFAVPWPNGVAMYKRGQIDDTPFTGGAAPPVVAPTYLNESAEVEVGQPNRVKMCWSLPPGQLMLPTSGATGWVVTVDGVGKTISSSARIGTTPCYAINLAAATITTDAQVVTLAYAPGNLTSNSTPAVAAVAFGPVPVANSLDPTPVPLMTLASYGFRSIFGLEDAASSPWYTNSSGVFENIPASFIQGAQFRLRMKLVTTVAAALPQSFFICTEQNESGTYTLLTNDCTANNTCFANAPALGDGQVTTQQLTPVVGTFVAGALLESEDTQVPITLPINSETEIEAAIQLSSTVPIGNRYRYRLCKAGGAALNAHTNTPLVTVIQAQTAVRGKGSE